MDLQMVNFPLPASDDLSKGTGTGLTNQYQILNHDGECEGGSVWNREMDLLLM